MRKLLTILLLLSPAVSFGAISLDATSSFTGAIPTASYSWNHTVGSGATILIVEGSTAGGTVTSSTYNGVAMTTIQLFDGGRNTFLYLANPPSGTHTVHIEISASDNTGWSAVSLFGTTTTNPIGASGTSGEIVNATSSVTITTVANNSWNVDVINCLNSTHNEGTPSGANQTLINEYGLNSSMANSTQTTTNAGSYTMQWSGIGSCSHTVQSVIEVIAGPSTPAVVTRRRQPVITFVE